MSDMLEDAIRVAKGLKASMVRRDGIGSDLGIVLTLLQGHRVLGSLKLLRTNEFQPEDLMDASTAISLSGASSVIHMSDSYCYFPEEDDASDPPDGPGEQARRFAAGDPSIHEGIVVVVMNRDGSCSAGSCAYRYDGRTVVWGNEETVEIDGVSGQVPDALRSGFEQQREWWGPPVRVADLAALLGRELVLMAAVPRNSPCPCGSGKKTKHCCWT